MFTITKIQDTHCTVRTLLVPSQKRHRRDRLMVQASNTSSYRTILGNSKIHQVSVRELAGPDGGDARFVCPFFASTNDQPRNQLPLLIYVPGIDGTGLAAYNQLENLSKGYQIELFLIPYEDKTDFQGLLNIFTNYLKKMVQPQMTKRMIYLFGESFGALLTLAAAYHCPEFIDRVILANPATAYSSSMWSNFAPLLPIVPKPLYSVVSGLMAPLIINPFELLRKNLDTTSGPANQSSQLINAGLDMLGTLEYIQENIDDKIITWKLQVVQQGIEHLKPYLHKVPQRTLILASEQDLLLPSATEAKRLQDIMLRAFVKVLPGKSHAFMVDSNFDLLSVLKEEGFYLQTRNLTSNIQTKAGKSLSLNNFGTSGPTEIPTKTELKKIASLVDQVNSLSSPVFLSTYPDGNIVQGIHAVPDSKPLLLVGNHVILGLDLNPLVHKFLEERNILLRGLAHPAVVGPQINQIPDESEVSPAVRIIGQLFDVRGTYKRFTTYGSVAVSPTNFHRLLSQGERVLLYPGGSREALKERDEKYRLFWPKRGEFVRMAAKFGATIATVASVGSEDGFEMILSSFETLETPLGDTLKKAARAGPSARNGVAAVESELMQVLAPPVVIPSRPSRFYFLIGKPYTLSPKDAEDREKCMGIYNQLKRDLESNISYLVEKREEDPYKDFETRVLYETLNRKQAPTFSLIPISS